MKKILLSIFTLAVVGITAKVEAQCTVAINNVVVQIVNTVPLTPTTCKITANVSFDLTYNGGATFVYFNSYRQPDYTALAISNPLDFECANSNTPARNAPNAGRLGTTINQPGKSFLDIGLDLSAGHPIGVGNSLPTTVLTTYSQDPTVALNTPANSGNFTVTRTLLASPANTDRFTITNLEVEVNNGCGAFTDVRTDVWASNANSANAKAQCYICGILQKFTDPTIAGFKNCATPARQYALGITTEGTTPVDITYKVYIDMNDNGGLDGADQLAFTSGIISLSNATPFSTGVPISLPGIYSNTQPYSEKGYLILVEGAQLANSVLKYFPHPQGCFILPVDFKSFTATRNRSSVVLKWETASEKNNMGFALERNNNGTWEQIAFVNSQAAGGNSDALLTYTYNDQNNSKGITQYRIKQVDLDNKSKYSEIRSVRGLDQIGKVTVYPNPTNNGTVNVVFDDASVIRTIAVLDMSGRTLKQINNVSNNNITIDNLQPGMYTLRIMVPATGEQTVQKIVVNKR